MDENKIRAIVKDEMRRSDSSSRFNFRSIPFHIHDGKGSEQIQANNVIPSVSVSGRISMAQEATYTLNLNASFTPRLITAYGVITGSYSGAANRVFTMGSAQLTPSFYFQTGTDTSVITGNIQYPFPTPQPDGSSQTVPMQSSAYISTNRGNVANTFAGASEDHLVDVVFPDPTSTADIKARVTVIGFSSTSVIVSVPYLESGWEIILDFVIS